MPKCNPKNSSAACGLSGSFETSGDGFNFSGSSAACNKNLCCNDCKCIEYGTIQTTGKHELFVCRCGTYKLDESPFTTDEHPVTLQPLDCTVADQTKLTFELDVFVADCVDGNILLDLTRVVDYVDAAHKAYIVDTFPNKKWPDPSDWPAIDIAGHRVGVAKLNVYNRGPYTVYLTCKDAASHATFEGVSPQIGCRAGEGLALLYTPVQKKWLVKTSYGS